MNYCQKEEIFIKTGSQRSRRLLSMFSLVLRKVLLSVIRGIVKKNCAVDLISKPKLQNRFKEPWKLCLNLCSRKWLRTTGSLVINLISLRLWQSKRLLADGLIIFRIIFLKILKLLEFLMLWSYVMIFHSIIVDGKKSF